MRSKVDVFVTVWGLSSQVVEEAPEAMRAARRAAV
jgi:hypothetical protein